MRRVSFKSCLVILVSLLWLLSITLPPVLQLLDEQTQYMTYTLNEEESKEQETSDSGEEILLAAAQEIQGHFFLFPSFSTGIHTSQSIKSFSPEIQLPPPEALS